MVVEGSEVLPRTERRGERSLGQSSKEEITHFASHCAILESSATSVPSTMRTREGVSCQRRRKGRRREDRGC